MIRIIRILSSLQDFLDFIYHFLIIEKLHYYILNNIKTNIHLSQYFIKYQSIKGQENSFLVRSQEKQNSLIA